jgi:hypothetical protein
MSYMTVVMIRIGPVEPVMLMGIPVVRDRKMPAQAVARMVSTAPI